MWVLGQFLWWRGTQAAMSSDFLFSSCGPLGRPGWGPAFFQLVGGAIFHSIFFPYFWRYISVTFWEHSGHRLFRAN
uniref:Secreted protein n=1 Tax=Ixodes ricinus TaxID=34613 RepID=A0A6B0TU01_IXORI